MKQLRVYFQRIYRVQRNTGPGGPGYRCDLGFWIPDETREKRDRFYAVRTVATGTKAQCLVAKETEEFLNREQPGRINL